MTKKTKHWLIGILTAIVAGFTVLNAVSYTHLTLPTKRIV